MDEKELRDFENRLRRFRPEGPPESLRQRVLAGRRRPSWAPLRLRVAAVLVIAASIPLNRWIEGEDEAPRAGNVRENPVILREGPVLGDALVSLVHVRGRRPGRRTPLDYRQFMEVLEGQ